MGTGILKNFLVCLNLAFIALQPVAAFSHASLQSSSPENNEILPVLPKRLQLVFGEEVQPGSILIIKPQSSTEKKFLYSVPGLTVEKNANHISMPLPELPSPGTYFVTWRAVSEDSHPVVGTFVFHYKKPSGNWEKNLIDDDHSHEMVNLQTVRFALYVSVFVLTGSLLFLSLARWQKEFYDKLFGLLKLAYFTAVISTLIVFFNHIFKLWGADFIAQPEMLSQISAAIFGSSFGVSFIVRIMSLSVMGIALTIRFGRIAKWLLLSGSWVLLSSFALSGHTQSHFLPRLISVALMFHLVAASFWVGGIASLIRLYSFRSLNEYSHALKRFSKFALLSVPVIIISGLYSANQFLESYEDLINNDYGKLLLGKIFFFAGAVLIGGFHHLFVVKRISQSKSFPVFFKKSLLLEICFVGLIFLMTSLLVEKRPPMFSVQKTLSTQKLVSAAKSINLAFLENRSGRRKFLITLDDSNSSERILAKHIELTLSLKNSEIEKIHHTLQPNKNREFEYSGPELTIDGSWEADLRISITDFDEIRGTMTVDVNGSF